MKRVLLIAYGEIFLKGKNRPFFLKKLRNLLKLAITLDENAIVTLSDSRFYISEYSLSNEDVLIERISKIFGIHSLSPAYEIDKDFDTIVDVGISLFRPLVKEGTTFKVQAKRADKRYQMNSMDLAAKIGEKLLEAYPALSVDLHKPQEKLFVEIRSLHAYVYAKKIAGLGGMPVGSSGKAMLLLSGGIDSPVAAFMMAKRGLQVEAVHFYSPPYTSERAKQKVIDLAKITKDYCGPIRLHIVPFTKIQEEIYEKCHRELLTVIMRRFMMKIAERIAVENECLALATGESLGQVASQTIQSLHATNECVDMLVLRPLLCHDKLDIIAVANKIGTYETSILPFEDCCTVFTPKHPATRPKIKALIKNEEKIDVEGLIQEAIEGVEIVYI